MCNGEAYLADALRSILSQSFRDFELIVIDDGSTDNTTAILEQFQREDERIRLCRQSHGGTAAAVNHGMSLAAGEYIARMDADDVCARERFETQVKYLDNHPDVGICGTWIEIFGMGRSEIVRYPCDDGTIRSRLLFESPLAQPAVMLRRSVVTQDRLSYDTTALAEDYDLWVRASRHTRFANIPAVLLRYRVHPNQIGSRLKEEQDASAQHIRLAQLHCLGIRPSASEADLHNDLSRWRFKAAPEFLRATRKWFLKLEEANEVVQYYPQAEFRMVLSQRWADVCAAATAGGVRTLIEFWRAPRLALSGVTPVRQLKFAVKCLIRKEAQAPFMKADRVAP